MIRRARESVRESKNSLRLQNQGPSDDAVEHALVVVVLAAVLVAVYVVVKLGSVITQVSIADTDQSVRSGPTH